MPYRSKNKKKPHTDLAWSWQLFGSACRVLVSTTDQSTTASREARNARMPPTQNKLSVNVACKRLFAELKTELEKNMGNSIIRSASIIADCSFCGLMEFPVTESQSVYAKGKPQLKNRARTQVVFYRVVPSAKYSSS